MTMKIALVVGACSGLGYSSALSLANAGVHIIGTYNSHSECPEEVVRELEWHGVRAVMIKLDAGLSNLQPFAREVAEALDETFGASKINNVVINIRTVLDSSSVTKRLDHWQFYVTHVRLPHLLTDAIGNHLTDACDVVLISSVDKRGSSSITSIDGRAITPGIAPFPREASELS